MSVDAEHCPTMNAGHFLGSYSLPLCRSPTCKSAVIGVESLETLCTADRTDGFSMGLRELRRVLRMAQNSRGALDRLLPRGLQGVSDPLVLCYSGPSAAVSTKMTGPWLCQPLLLQDSVD